MIKNDRQYRITKAAVTRFAESLRALETGRTTPTPGVDPIIQQAERNAIKSQLDELRAELREYEELASGRWACWSWDRSRNCPRPSSELGLLPA